MIQVIFLKDYSGTWRGAKRSQERQDWKDRDQSRGDQIVQASGDSSLGQGGSRRDGENQLDSEYTLKVVLQDLLMDWMREVEETEESYLSHH